MIVFLLLLQTLQGCLPFLILSELSMHFFSWTLKGYKVHLERLDIFEL